ncbi:hypothetical protein GCM10010347_20210 [Streptomyces cirratus]|uniref:Uncharacterized protein n=1 Tax=Streptomyces cirratus TaxID=68187 RepID=A0ABQ3EXQ2_9ACTN|nr:immunity 49 family protein [Streptomyces cirratus]GHB50618.1 hypothetical protein GCM10010347_20210 [Streptomyces cirratus]
MPAAHAEDLPHALVTGFGTRGPRVTGFDFLRKALAPADGEPLAVWQLAGVRTLPDGADLFRIGLAEPDAHAEVSVEGRTLCYPARPGEEVGAGNWQRAVALALITGVREDLAPLVLTGPAFARPDGSAFRAYREALHTHLTCNDAEAAAQRTLEQDEKAAGRRTLPRSTASQNACAETASGSAACRGNCSKRPPAGHGPPCGTPSRCRAWCMRSFWGRRRERPGRQSCGGLSTRRGITATGRTRHGVKDQCGAKAQHLCESIEPLHGACGPHASRAG